MDNETGMTDNKTVPEVTTLSDMIDNITPDIHQKLKTAVELGKWADGNVLTSQQRDLCLQAVIMFDAKNLPEHEQVGYIDNRKLKNRGQKT